MRTHNANSYDICVRITVVLYTMRYIQRYKAHRLLSRSSQCSTTGVTKAVLSAILPMEWCT